MQALTSTDVRVTRIEEITALLTAYGTKHAQELAVLGEDLEDFVQSILENIFRRSGLGAYDESKCRSFEALIFNIASRQIIDLQRKRWAKSRVSPETNRPYERISMETPLAGTEDELTLGDVLSGEEDMMVIFSRILDRAPDLQISPNYILSWKQLLELSVENSEEEIAAKIGISASRIRQLQQQLVRDFLRTGE